MARSYSARRPITALAATRPAGVTFTRVETLEDGTMNIVVEGGNRFRLLELTHGRSFNTGVVEEMTDDDDPAAPDDITRALELFFELAEIAGGEVDVPDPDTEQLDFELAARIDFGVDAKQELLTSTSPRRRMERLVELLDAALEAVRLEQTLRERAGQNGKVAPLETDPDDDES